MPYIIRDFLNDTTTVSSAELAFNVERDFPCPFINGARKGYYSVYYTNRFYLDLKMILQQTNLEITFDDTKWSFNVFGVNFYVILDGFYGLIPTIYKENDLDWYTPFSVGYIPSISGYNRRKSELYVNQTSFTMNSGNLFNYRINVHYNDNFLHVTYGPVRNMNLVLPLFFVMKGKTIENEDVVYLAGECNTSSISSYSGYSYNNFYAVAGGDNSYNTIARCPVGHNLYYVNDLQNPLITDYNGNITGWARQNINPFAIFSNLKQLNQFSLNKVLKNETNKNKYIKTKPIVLGGLIDFENCLEAPDDMPGGLYYEIDEENYFLPKVQYEVDWNGGGNAYSTYTACRHRLLLKI